MPETQQTPIKSHAERAALHRELIQSKLQAAAEVLRRQHDALINANRQARVEHCYDFHELSVDDRKLEFRLFEHGLAIQVVRDATLLNVLRVANLIVIDQQGTPITDPEGYFSKLVGDFVRGESSTALS